MNKQVGLKKGFRLAFAIATLGLSLIGCGAMETVDSAAASSEGEIVLQYPNASGTISTAAVVSADVRLNNVTSTIYGRRQSHTTYRVVGAPGEVESRVRSAGLILGEQVCAERSRSVRGTIFSCSYQGVAEVEGYRYQLSGSLQMSLFNGRWTARLNSLDSLRLLSAPAVAPTPSQEAPIVRNAFTMLRGDSVQNSTANFVFQGDGNLVLYVNGRAVFHSMTFNSCADHVEFQTDGNLVVYCGSEPLWYSNTGIYPGSQLILQPDGNVVIQYGNSIVWRAF